MEREREWWNCALPSLRLKQEQPPENTQDPGAPVSSPCQAEGSTLKERRERWRQGHAWGGRRTPSLPTLPSHVLLYCRSGALDVEGQSVGGVDDGPSTPEVLPRSESPTPGITTTSTRTRRQVTVVGDSLLRGTEGPTCRADLLPVWSPG